MYVRMYTCIHSCNGYSNVTNVSKRVLQNSLTIPMIGYKHTDQSTYLYLRLGIMSADNF